MRPVLLIIGCLVLVSACAVPPAVQMAGTAMTTYDIAVMAEEHIPRDRVAFHGRYDECDEVIERRLAEDLRDEGLVNARAYSVDGHVYLIAVIRNRAEADRCIDLAQVIQGVRKITCRFYPDTEHMPFDFARARSETMALRARLAADPALEGWTLRALVLRGEAVLVGKVPDETAHRAAVGQARTLPGVTTVIDYLKVEGQAVAPPEAAGGAPAPESR